MRAIWYEKLGPANEVLTRGEMPDPVPGPGEVRVKIAWSGVNPSDVKRRAGAGGTGGVMPFPRVIPDMDGSGIIDRVGPGVDERRIGERVWLHSTQWKRPYGTAAEFAVTPDKRAVSLPNNIPLDAAASLGVPAMTAHRAVFGQGPVTGKTVLVTGGAGAVGFYAIQLARWAGARVITTVSGPEKAELALQAGADSIVNYRKHKVEEKVDHIVEVDFGANLEQTLACLKDGGTVATYASMGKPEPAIPFYPMMFKNLGVLWVFVYELPAQAMEQATREVNAWLATGKAVFPPFAKFSLDRLVDAHVAVEKGAVGKVLAECGGGV